MTAADLLADLHTRGIRVSLSGRDLIVDAPVKKHSGDISLLRVHKDAVVRLLIARRDAGGNPTLHGRIYIRKTPPKPATGGIVDATGGLRAEPPPDIPPDWAEDWHERAAVREYEGHMPRDKAERAAADDVLKMVAEQEVTP